MTAGAVALRDALHLVEDPQALYPNVDNEVRRHLNDTFYGRFCADDFEITSDKKLGCWQTCTELCPTTLNRRPIRNSPGQVEAVRIAPADVFTSSNLFRSRFRVSLSR